MDKRMDAVMTDEQVVIYTRLVARRTEIVMRSGASWKPEYAQELEDIDRKLAALRVEVDAALEGKAAAEQATAGDVKTDIIEDRKENFIHYNCISCLYYRPVDGKLTCAADMVDAWETGSVPCDSKGSD